MKGVNYITDSNNKKIAVQIDLKLLEQKEDVMQDFIDGIIAESRINEKRIPLTEVVNQLKLKGKL
jgi:hypothetical protein